MEQAVPQRWLELGFAGEDTGEVRVRLGDERGYERGTFSLGPVLPGTECPGPSPDFARALAELVVEGRHGWRKYRGRLLSVESAALPLILRVPPGWEALRWEEWLGASLASAAVPRDHYQVVRRREGSPLVVPEPLPLLPLRLLVETDGWNVKALAARVPSFSLLKRVGAVEWHEASSGSLGGGLRRWAPRLVIAWDSSFDALSELLTREPMQPAPRLLVVCVRPGMDRVYRSLPLGPGVLPGTALWLLPLERESELRAAVVGILRGLVDDPPLHELVATTHAALLRQREVSAMASPWVRAPVLFSAPGLAPWTRLLGDPFLLRRIFDSARLEFEQGGSSPVPPAAAARPWPGASPGEDAILALNDDLREPGVAGDADDVPPGPQLRFPPLSRVVESPREKSPEERRVSMALARLEPTPLDLPAPKRRWVGRNVSLRQGAPYLLKLVIGPQQPGSLMTEPPPPLDPLLPPHQLEHELQVAFFTRDFTLEGAATRTVWLRHGGPSEPVNLTLFAPMREGLARLGVALYHQQNLLQAFTLEALITPEEQLHEGAPVLTVRFEGATTETFKNVLRLRPRALSICMVEAQGDTGDVHLRAYARKRAVTIRLSELMTSDRTAEYRRILQAASVHPDAPLEPRFLAYPPSPDAQKPGIEEVLAQLGRLGCDLYRALLLETPDASELLAALGSQHDQVIQVLRARTTQTFPWPILYDFPEPEERVGAPAPVCLGFEPGDVSKPCACPLPDRWCARGFWGIRHQVEELMGGGAPEDVVQAIEQPGGGCSVSVACGDQDGGSRTMLKDLAGLMHENRLRTLDLRGDVLAPLWAEDRPAVFIVLGHLETRELPGEPRGPRIVLVPKAKWLQDKHIIDRCRGGKTWRRQPRSLVMVLSCLSGAVEPATVTDFVRAFKHAGAAAVIGTECTAFSGLLGRFGTYVTRALLEQRTLGEAVTGFRRQLLTERNPLGFIFNVVGSADLVLAHAAA
jgi:hypothetical protein